MFTAKNISKWVLMLTAWALMPCALFSYTRADNAHEGDGGEAQRRLTYYYLAAQQYKAQDKISAMTEALRHCLDINPNDPASNFDMALLHMSIGQDSTALNLLKRAVSNDPKNPWYMETLASFYLSLHKMEEAVPILEQMSKIQTKRTDILAQLFQLYKSGGRTEDAIHVLDRIQLLQGNNTRIASQKYALYLDLGDTAMAFNQLKTLCKEYPYDASSLLLLADQYMTANMPDSALATYDKVERIDPHNVMLQTSRLQYHLLVGDTVRFREARDSVVLSEHADISLRINALSSVVREALQDTTRRVHAERMFAILLAPEKPDVSFLQMYMTYRLYIHNAKEEELVPIMERILVVDPSNMQTLQDLLRHYAMKADIIRVGELCQNALIYYPSELAFHYYLALSLAQQEKLQEAVDALTTAIRQANEESRPDILGDVYSLLGDVHHQMGHEKEVYQAFDSCLVYTPDNVSCLNNYAYYLSLKGEQLEKAEKMSYRSIKAEPTNKTFLDTYAWVLFVQEDYTTARIYMDRVVDPAQADSTLLADEDVSSTVLEHAGDIYFQCGQAEQAVRFWQLARQKAEPDAKNALLNKKIKKRKYFKK